MIGRRTAIKSVLGLFGGLALPWAWLGAKGPQKGLESTEGRISGVTLWKGPLPPPTSPCYQMAKDEGARRRDYL